MGFQKNFPFIDEKYWTILLHHDLLNTKYNLLWDDCKYVLKCRHHLCFISYICIWVWSAWRERPRKQIWDLIRKYTNAILFIKFFWTYWCLNHYYKTNDFYIWMDWFKLAYDHELILKLTLYMMSEIIIISFIFLNEIKQKLLVLNEETEENIEHLKDAI